MKRIALLSTNFYPAPFVGAVRITNWARILPGLGYEPLAIHRDYGYRASPEDLASQVHPQVGIVPFQNSGKVAPPESVPTSEVYGTRRSRLAGFVASAMYQCIVPDSQWLFWKRVYPHVLACVQDFRPDVILSTAPSFSLHEVGRLLKRDLHIPWIADYRDPMLLDDRFRPQGPLRLMWPRYAAFERRIYSEADAIVHAIPLHARWARMRYKASRLKCALLRHPVPADLAGGEVAPHKSALPGRRSISVVGYIRPQVVGMLAKAIKQLVMEDPTRFDLEFRLIGRELDDPQPLMTLLGERLIITGRLRHDLAKQHIAGADVLVNAVTVERQKATNISSKLYEYAAARKPIIAINPTRSDRLLLRELSALVVNEPTVESLKTALKNALAIDPASTGGFYQRFLEQHSWQCHAQRFRLVLDYVQGAKEAPRDLRELDSVALAKTS